LNGSMKRWAKCPRSIGTGYLYYRANPDDAS